MRLWILFWQRLRRGLWIPGIDWSTVFLCLVGEFGYVIHGWPVLQVGPGVSLQGEAGGTQARTWGGMSCFLIIKKTKSWPIYRLIICRYNFLKCFLSGFRWKSTHQGRFSRSRGLRKVVLNVANSKNKLFTSAADNIITYMSTWHACFPSWRRGNVECTLFICNLFLCNLWVTRPLHCLRSLNRALWG